ncbi:hypothetical protein IFM89_013744 [Coptis chinensis]|uniref:Cell wall hydroxyproline-rich glycoprotein n=1 Tax=Coptis chinensis TaxID=261450 RepID=A0A835HUR8_9MAGN|nr:hypothetical protein IFM89_013744 [Coptis chinensis]
MTNLRLSLGLCCLFCVVVLASSSHQDSPPPPNPRLQNACKAFQAWKDVISSDPKNFTSNWNSQDVCKYNGVYCAPSPDDPNITTVAGIDLNHADIVGSLPEELGLLIDLALFHISSNHFHGVIPESFGNLHLLYEFDVSNNQFTGPFPSIVLYLTSLKYLDIRFNEFQGDVPSRLFDLKLDAIFINNNKFQFSLPKNIGNTSASVLVLANNNLCGFVPSSLARLGRNVNEINLMNCGIRGRLPLEIGWLKNLTVFDVSFNRLVGSLPKTIVYMRSLELLNVANNKFSGDIPASICSLPKLQNFTYSFNFFHGESQSCLKIPDNDNKNNCIPGQPLQRSLPECKWFLSHPVVCNRFRCSPKKAPTWYLHLPFHRYITIIKHHFHKLTSPPTHHHYP